MLGELARRLAVGSGGAGPGNLPGGQTGGPGPWSAVLAALIPLELV
jgi:hypothetical protein